MREADADVVGSNRDDRASAAVNFHIFSAEGPIPRSLQDGLRFGVGEDDGGFVVDVWVNVRLDLLRNCCDGKWALAVHEPGHQIGAVAAEIEERAGAVEFCIGEPC